MRYKIMCIGLTRQRGKLLFSAPLPSPLGRVAERQRGRERCRRLKRTSNQRLAPPQPRCALLRQLPQRGSQGHPYKQHFLSVIPYYSRTATIQRFYFSARRYSPWEKTGSKPRLRYRWLVMGFFLSTFRVAILPWDRISFLAVFTTSRARPFPRYAGRV